MPRSLAFERAAAAGKDEMAGPYLMAETLAGLGRRADAQRWAREALRRSPNDPRARQLVDTTDPPMRRRLVLAAVAAVALVAGCGPRASRSPEFPGAPVVLVSIDTLRADHLPAYGYAKVATPNIDALQRDSILFENAYSQVPLTLPSHLSMLTGLLPAEHGVRTNLGYHFDGSAHPTLARTLRKHGYATGAAVSSYVLRGATGIDDSWDLFDDSVGGDVEWTRDVSLLKRPGARDGTTRPGLGRGREGEAVLPVRAPLRAAPPLRAARALPHPLRGDLRRRGRGGRRRRRRARRRPQARRPLRSRDRPPRLRPRRRARGPRGAGARDPALPRGPPRPAPAEAAGLARRRVPPRGARRADRHRTHGHFPPEARGPSRGRGRRSSSGAGGRRGARGSTARRTTRASTSAGAPCARWSTSGVTTSTGRSRSSTRSSGTRGRRPTPLSPTPASRRP